MSTFLKLPQDTMKILIQPSAQWFKFYFMNTMLRAYRKATFVLPDVINDIKQIDGIFDCVIEGANDPSSTYLDKYKQLSKSSKTKVIVVTGEPYYVNQHFVHLIIDCKKILPLNCNWLYLPNYVMGMSERSYNARNLLLPDGFDPKEAFSLKTKFCAYMYSNTIAHREKFYDALAKYKPVDALGHCKHPQGLLRQQTDRLCTDVMDRAVEKYKPYKFVIAMENTLINGYITEKLINPVLARCIPIYLGAPDIFNDGIINRKCMIHIADFKTYEDCVEYAKIVDEHDDLYLQYLQEPLFVDNKLPKYFDSDFIMSNFVKLF
jgi:hypothetical protein